MVSFFRKIDSLIDLKLKQEILSIRYCFKVKHPLSIRNIRADQLKKLSTWNSKNLLEVATKRKTSIKGPAK